MDYLNEILQSSNNKWWCGKDETNCTVIPPGLKKNSDGEIHIIKNEYEENDYNTISCTFNRANHTDIIQESCLNNYDEKTRCLYISNGNATYDEDTNMCILSKDTVSDDVVTDTTTSEE